MLHILLLAFLTTHRFRIQLAQNPLPFVQVRGPLDFIGNWIQSSEWFPVEINVPDTFASVGNGIGTLATNVGNGFNAFTQNLGSGFQTFTQNVGSNVQNFAQNLSQRFPVLAVVVRPNAPARYFALVPVRTVGGDDTKKPYLPAWQMESDVLEAFP